MKKQMEEDEISFNETRPKSVALDLEATFAVVQCRGGSKDNVSESTLKFATASLTHLWVLVKNMGRFSSTGRIIVRYRCFQASGKILQVLPRRWYASAT